MQPAALRGKGGDDLIATWKSKIKWYSENKHFEDESNRRNADGVRVENIPRNHSVGPPREIQKLMTDLQCELEHFKDVIIFMSMYNDIEWKAEGNKEQCECNSQTVANYVRKFPRGHWSFLGPGSEDNLVRNLH